MSAHCGTLAIIRAFVEAHPGCTIRQIIDGATPAGYHENSARALVSQAKLAGQIFRVGTPMHFYYFADQQEAREREPAILAAIQAERAAKYREKWQRNNAKRYPLPHKAPGRPRRDGNALADATTRARSAPPPHVAAINTEVLRLAALDGGFHCMPMRIGDQSFSAKTVASRVLHLIHHGLLFRGKISHKKVRYFRTAEAAAAFVYSSDAVAAPVTLRLTQRADAEVIIPPSVKVQRIPHAPSRFAVELPRAGGQITADWMLRRHGGDVGTVLAAE